MNRCFFVGTSTILDFVTAKGETVCQNLDVVLVSFVGRCYNYCTLVPAC